MVFRQLYYPEVDSTNLQASALLSLNQDQKPFVVYTDYQTGGKGQGANSWHSQNGLNILCSYVVFPRDLNIEENFSLSILASLAVSDVLEILGIGHCIKWPNDILVRGNKIAGILIENRLQGGNILSSVIGIGLNVNQLEFPPFSPAAISLRQLTGEVLDRDLIRGHLTARVAERCNEMMKTPYDSREKQYLSKLFGLNEERLFRTGTKEFLASIRGVDPGGRLILETGDGEKTCWDFKEVEYLSVQKR